MCSRTRFPSSSARSRRADHHLAHGRKIVWAPRAPIVRGAAGRVAAIVLFMLHMCPSKHWTSRPARSSRTRDRCPWGAPAATAAAATAGWVATRAAGSAEAGSAAAAAAAAGGGGLGGGVDGGGGDGGSAAALGRRRFGRRRRRRVARRRRQRRRRCRRRRWRSARAVKEAVPVQHPGVIRTRCQGPCLGSRRQ